MFASLKHLMRNEKSSRQTDGRTCSPLGVEVLRLPVGNGHPHLVRAWQWWRRRAHGGPALRVGGAVEPLGNRRTVPAPGGPRGRPVARRQGLRLGLLLHGLHLIFLRAAPGETKGDAAELAAHLSLCRRPCILNWVIISSAPSEVIKYASSRSR